MDKEADTGREPHRRILYVDSGHDPAGRSVIENALRELGEVCVRTGLSRETVGEVRESLEACPFDAMVSHLPPARGARAGWSGIDLMISKYESYGPALDVLKKIRRMTEMPIVVYTGAGLQNLPALALESSGADRLIEKTRDAEKDARKLVGAIRYEWKRSPDAPEEAQIERSADGASLLMETVLRQRGGLGMALGCLIAKLFEGIPGRIEKLAPDGTVEEERPLNDLFEISALCAIRGSRLRIRLDSSTPQAGEALRAAQRLLNGTYL
ncbi:MAG: hypothetical protein ACP5I4_16380 [Oceanipulchritudo sp.]